MRPRLRAQLTLLLPLRRPHPRTSCAKQHAAAAAGAHWVVKLALAQLVDVDAALLKNLA